MKTIIYEGISAEGDSNKMLESCIKENIDLLNQIYTSNAPKTLISKLNLFNRTKFKVRLKFNDIGIDIDKQHTLDSIKAIYDKEKFHKYAYLYTCVEYLTNYLDLFPKKPQHVLGDISRTSFDLLMALKKHNLNFIPKEFKEHLKSKLSKYGLLDTPPEKPDYAKTFSYFTKILIDYIDSNSSNRPELKTALYKAHDLLSNISNGIYRGCSTEGSIDKFKSSLDGYKSPFDTPSSSGAFDSWNASNNLF